MKRYKLEHDFLDHSTGGVYPSMMASRIESQEVLDRSKSHFTSFFPGDVSFRGMFPSYGYDRGEPHAICDMHTWIESNPPALVYPVSPRFQDLLSKFHVPELRFYNGSVKWKGHEYPYYVMHLLTRQQQYIDFRHSTFVKSDYDGEKDINAIAIQGSSLEELRKKFSPESYTFQRAVMQPAFRDLDIYYIETHGIIISERLKEAIEAAHFTGVKITDCPINFEFSDSKFD